MSSTAAPPRAENRSRVYHAVDWGGWAILVIVVAVFAGTGVTIRAALIGQRHPVAGDVALLAACAVALAWGLMYFAFRVSVRAVVTPAGFELWHGWWRHTIAWHDVARFSEWQALSEGIRYRWLALWSVDGLRLQVRQDLVRDFGELRADVMRHLAGPRRTPPDFNDLNKPLALSEESAPLVSGWLVAAAILCVGGSLIFVFLTDLSLVGLTMLALGVACSLAALARYELRQRVSVGPDGVTARRGPRQVALTWAATYGLHRERREPRGGVLPILRRGLVMVLYRLDSRSGLVPGQARAESVITIRGNSGERITVRERCYQHPEWLRARLRAEVTALRERAAPLAPNVVPLPPTGPLARDVVLPPDPGEDSATLWMREG